jgi:hypothetical protein
MTYTVISSFLIAQLGGIHVLLLAICGLWCGAARCPWGDGVKEARSWYCCCHSLCHSLPVIRPEDVEACQCEGVGTNVGIGSTRWSDDTLK